MLHRHQSYGGMIGLHDLNAIAATCLSYARPLRNSTDGALTDDIHCVHAQKQRLALSHATKQSL